MSKTTQLRAGIDRAFPDRDWHRLPLVELVRSRSALMHMTPRMFRAYLPALLGVATQFEDDALILVETRRVHALVLGRTAATSGEPRATASAQRSTESKSMWWQESCAT